LSSAIIQEFKKYKPSLLFIGLVDLFFKHLNSTVKSSEEENIATPWTELFGTYLRKNDIFIMDACRTVLKEFEENLFVCETWIEIFDVLGN
jgi:hypothetical protein